MLFFMKSAEADFMKEPVASGGLKFEERHAVLHRRFFPPM
jgi:hypothetical protein